MLLPDALVSLKMLTLVAALELNPELFPSAGLEIGQSSVHHCYHLILMVILSVPLNSASQGSLSTPLPPLHVLLPCVFPHSSR